MPPSEDLIEIIQAGIQSVRPSVIFPSILTSATYAELDAWLRADVRYLLCVGKASLDTAEAVLNQVRCRDHFVLAPSGAGVGGASKVRYGSHPIPDERSLKASQELLGWIKYLPDNSSLMVVISGGSSALLVMPAPGLSLESKRKVNDLLIRSGATIQEMNIVRKHLSLVKGGRMASFVSHVKCFALVISDVVGDDLATIGSGPFYPDPSTFSEAAELLHRYGIWDDTPEDARDILERGERGQFDETPKQIVPPIPHYIVASNRIACEAAAAKAARVGYQVQLLPGPVSGPIDEVAQKIAHRVKDMNPRTALIMGGEVTVRVRGSGTGGRNQHLTLLLTDLFQNRDVAFAAVGTDGIDGNSTAAGAWTDGQTLRRALQLGLHPQQALDEFDSFPFFRRLGQSIQTGPTGTNVMDLYVALT